MPPSLSRILPRTTRAPLSSVGHPALGVAPNGPYPPPQSKASAVPSKPLYGPPALASGGRLLATWIVKLLVARFPARSAAVNSTLFSCVELARFRPVTVRVWDPVPLPLSERLLEEGILVQ